MIVIVHLETFPIRDFGSAMPNLVPPLAAAGVATLLCRRNGPDLAYISGSLGTLMGGDLFNLDKIEGLGEPVASVGGAGALDGIFLTAAIAFLLARIMNEVQDNAWGSLDLGPAL